MENRILVTGGAGFIGSNFILRLLGTDLPGTGLLQAGGVSVVNLDLLTYAGNPGNLASVSGSGRYALAQGDICDGDFVARIFADYRPRAVVHFAAESHVDRSILGPDAFLRTNVQGTFQLLQQAREYWQTLGPGDREGFRFLHVSTDEVFGSLGPEDAPFSEVTPYAPNSPYAASKAASDHLARAWHHTYGLPVITTVCSNNFGPYQFPEKLIPLMILHAMDYAPLPVYGDGANVRDWLFVEDHCLALRAVLERGRPGETYAIGGRSERRNLDVVQAICDMLDELSPQAGRGPRRELITFVADRPGHDRRYAMNCAKIEQALGWRPAESFESGLRKTIQWYLDNPGWIEGIRTGAYLDWIKQNYEERLAR